MGQEDRKTAEAAKVRLVRCPKCENLLPELPDFPLYQCGGCGAVLKAKTKGLLEDRLSEKTDDIKGPRISEGSGIGHISEFGIEKENGIEHGVIDRSHNEKVSSDGSSTLQVENGEVKSDSEISRRERERMVIMESKNDDHGSYGSGLVRDDRDWNANGLEHTNFKGEHAFKELASPMESLKSRPLPVDKPDVAASVGPVKGVAAQVRFNDHLYHGEGPSSHGTNSYYEYGERTRYQDADIDGRARVKNLENDRAELLRKLDELKDQISQSCHVADRHKERIVPDRMMVSPSLSDHCGRYPSTYVQESLTSSHGIDNKPLSPYDLESPYLGHMAGFNPYTDRYGLRGRESYPQSGFAQEFLAHGDTYHQEKLRGRTLQSESPYMHLPYNEQFPGYFANANHDQIMLHSHENFFHQSACSCVHCHNKNLHLPPKVDHLGVHNQRLQNELSTLNFHGFINPAPHGPQGYNFGGSGLYQLNSRQSLHKNSSDVDSENIRSNYHHPRKMAVSHRSGGVCRPIAGGAPFITCCNCFELLKLPKKCISSAKMQHKMKCGACSSIISFEAGSNGCIGSVSVHVDQVPNEIDEGSSGTVDENVIYWPGDTNSADLNCDSKDYDDLPAKFSPIDRKSNSGESEKLQDPLSSTLHQLKNEQSPENITLRKHDSSYIESPLKEINSCLNPELLTKERTNHFPDTKVTGQSDDGNRSKRSEPDRIAFGGTNFRQNSVAEGIVATEMDVSLNDFSNSCVSQDSRETSKADHRKVNKGSESFFAGLIKKSFRDITKNNQNFQDGGSLVFVNGRVIPDRVVKKAEKLAGPIQPGEYWYDKCAGFWGVMGHPCLGIIMPNIEEFNYPIPKNCAAGNTGVFVNGRELHQKDLDLLSSRGLPITRHRSYKVEISGKVIDELTGEELDLGKLAPTRRHAWYPVSCVSRRCYETTSSVGNSSAKEEKSGDQADRNREVLHTTFTKRRQGLSRRPLDFATTSPPQPRQLSSVSLVAATSMSKV
ncbi:hypothetical protein F511_00577 [Dorcoceras hygrometricum]|uniref:Uncharacterized protein n=1 Tax=Dorcoceras hygrometricum TaxID=472368 RepID=A0A2Z7BB99_9LAMI|nr:hypothetical protein F511_00577 [Dorcoceras hygrometricum]